MSAVTVGMLLVLGVFALRGAVLGITALLARLAAMAAGYLAVFHGHALSSHWLAGQWPEIPPLIFQLAAGLLLFLAGAVAATWLLHLFFWLLRLHPAMDEALAEKTVAGRVTGAAVNSLLGLVLIMAGVWGYKLAQPALGLPGLPQQLSVLESGADKLALWALGGRSLKLPAVQEKPAGSGSPKSSVATRHDDKAHRAASSKGAADSSAEGDLPASVPLPGQALLQQKMAGELQQLADNPDKAKKLIAANAPLLKRMIDSGLVRLDPDPANNQAKLAALKEMINNPEQLEKALNDPAVRTMFEEAGR